MEQLINGMSHKIFHVFKIITLFLALIFPQSILAQSPDISPTQNISSDKYNLYNEQVTKYIGELYDANIKYETATKTLQKIIKDHVKILKRDEFFLTMMLEHSLLSLENYDNETFYILINLVHSSLKKVQKPLNAFQKKIVKGSSSQDQEVEYRLLKHNVRIHSDVYWLMWAKFCNMKSDDKFCKDLTTTKSNFITWERWKPSNPVEVNLRLTIDTNLIRLLESDQKKGKNNNNLRIDFILAQILSIASNSKDYVDWVHRTNISGIALYYFHNTGRKALAMTLMEEAALAINDGRFNPKYIRTNLRFYIYDIKNAFYNGNELGVKSNYDYVLSNPKHFTKIDELEILLYGLEVFSKYKNIEMLNSIEKRLLLLLKNAPKNMKETITSVVKLQKYEILNRFEDSNSNESVTSLAKKINFGISTLYKNNSITMEYDNLGTILKSRINLKKFIKEKKYDLAYEQFINYEKFLNVSLVKSGEYTTKSSPNRNVYYQKDFLYEIFATLPIEEKKKYSSRALKIISEWTKNTSEKELSYINFSNNEKNVQLQYSIKKYLETVKIREYHIEKFIRNFYKFKESYSIDTIEYLKDKNVDFSDYYYFNKGEKDFSEVIRDIKYTKNDFFEEQTFEKFDVNKLQEKLLPNQVFFFYDLSDNYIFTCFITDKDLNCNAETISPEDVNLTAKKIQDDVSNNKLLKENYNYNTDKDKILKIFFPKFNSNKKYKTIFVNLYADHLGLPLNYIFSSEHINEIVLVPSLNSSVIDYDERNRSYDGEYFGIGGAIFNKTKHISGLDKFFNIRSAENLSAISALEYLPGTKNEILSFANYFNKNQVKSLIGKNASEINLRNSSFYNYKYIHIASHGLTSGNLKLSEPGLALTPGDYIDGEINDGILTASEISELNFNTDTVILSACETATDYGKKYADGIAGLSLAFLKAGASEIVVSQWKVDDTATSKLFMNSIKINKKNEVIFNIASGMEKVKIENPSPYYWSGFIKVSSPSRYNRKINYKKEHIVNLNLQNHINSIGVSVSNDNETALVINKHKDKNNYEKSVFIFNKNTKDFTEHKFDQGDRNSNMLIKKFKKDFISVEFSNDNFLDIHNKIGLNSLSIQRHKSLVDRNPKIIGIVKIPVKHNWMVNDFMLNEGKVHIIFSGKGSLSTQKSKNFIPFFYIIYDLKKQSQVFYKKFENFEEDSLFDTITSKILKIDNKILIALNKKILKKSHYSYNEEITGGSYCKKITGDTYLFSLQEDLKNNSIKNTLNINDIFENTRIIFKANNDSNIKNILIEKQNENNCYTSLYITDSDLNYKKFIADGIGLYHASLINNKDGISYISISRSFLKDSYKNNIRDKKYSEFIKAQIKSSQEAYESYSNVMNLNEINTSIALGSNLYGGEIYSFKDNNIKLLKKFYNRYPDLPFGLFISDKKLFSMNFYNLSNYKINYIGKDM